jgi:hypothetical protein
LDKINHSREAVTRRILALHNTNEIVADEVNQEAGIPYSCPAQGTTIATIVTMLIDQT